MRRCCEVCEAFRPSAELETGQRLVEVSFAQRSVWLCVGHARIAENSGVKSFSALRALYGRGRRSFVPRRGPDTVFQYEQRENPGRRAGDTQRF